ncbi:hypothetical protein [Escherichia sp. E4742]|uniref:hypothetical protein n=1 Tax=Escherichia sp. E4742 TaxID=2044467 RepID=UPI0010802EBB|nr:hypothetical protein [Escherichia sp. E4742]QCT87613.1 hypothetical protein FEM44_10530 [Escherichia sp. E4742]TLJ06844.1 hypothetical protein FEK62_10525 [Escherichia sp. E4742]
MTFKVTNVPMGSGYPKIRVRGESVTLPDGKVQPQVGFDYMEMNVPGAMGALASQAYINKGEPNRLAIQHSSR